MTIHVHKKLRLRTLHAKDAQRVFKVVNRNRDDLRAWMPWVDGIVKENDIKVMIEDWQRAYVKGTDMVLGIFLGWRYIGHIDLHNIKAVIKKAEIGYWLGKKYRGRGIMTACVKALINYAFHVLCLDHIVIRCDMQNSKGRAIPERLGFTLMHMEKGVSPDGTPLETAVYGLDKSAAS